MADFIAYCASVKYIIASVLIPYAVGFIWLAICLRRERMKKP